MKRSVPAGPASGARIARSPRSPKPTHSAPRGSRRYRGNDVVAWLDQLGHYDLPIDRHPDGAAVRKKPNHYVTGRDGGRDIDLRRFALEGMQLHGRLLNVSATGFELGADLAQNLERADATNARIKATIDQSSRGKASTLLSKRRTSRPSSQPPRAPSCRSVRPG